MYIVYLILAHQHPELLARLVTRLLDSGGIVVVHYDSNAGEQPMEELRQLLGEDYQRVIWAERVPVVWGEWSLVQATLNGLRAVEQSGHEPEYVCLLSGSDYPVRPISELKAFLARSDGREYIESFSDREHFWVTKGIQSERYQYRFPFNWGKNPRLFSFVLWAQKMLRWKRKIPQGIDPHFGSQWWVLTWKSCAAILERCADKTLVRYFRGVWVSDELFFQTMIRAVADSAKICSHSLTLYQFSENGTPVTYCNGHEEYLARQNFFFARKVSPWAYELRDGLDAIASGERKPYRVQDGEIGIRSSEYDEHCRIYDHGLLNKPMIGRVCNERLGDLDWSRKPYLVVAGFCFQELWAVQEFLNGHEGVNCHGQLFHPAQIDFNNYPETYAGFHRHDQALRDQDPANFLVQVVQQDGDRKTAFTVNLGSQRNIMQTLVADPNARFIILEGDPVRAFHESRKGRAFTSDAPGQAHAELLDDQERTVNLFAGYYRPRRKYFVELYQQLAEYRRDVLYLQDSIEETSPALNESSLLEFFQGQTTESLRVVTGGQRLYFQSRLERPERSAALNLIQDSIDRCFPI